MNARPRVRAVVGALLATLVLPLAGCGLLPTEGPVARDDRLADEASPPNADFVPPGPADGDSRVQVVQGFLMAMTGVPLSTSVARRYLTAAARDRWRPAAGTIAYESKVPTLVPERSEVRLALGGVRSLDARGAWQHQASSARTLELHMVREGGQWRLDDPPDQLVVPTWYLDDQYRAEQLWYFDRTGRTMVSERVYLPQTDDLASALVRALLRGPADGASGAQSYLPPRSRLEISVVVRSGVADVPLRAPLRALSQDRLRRAVAQLSQTLRQADDVRRMRLLAEDSPLTLPGGERSVAVDVPPAYDAVGIGTADLYGIRGSVVRTGDEVQDRVAGPFGQPGLRLRSIAARPGRDAAGEPGGDGIAGVGQDGAEVLTGAPAGSTSTSPVEVYRGTDVLRPSFDLLGGLWLVDRRGPGRGARVVLVRDGRSAALDVPGVSGRDVVAFVVSPDGGALAALVRTTGGARVVLSRLVRRADGTVVSAGPARQLSRLTGPLATVVDMSWYGSQDLAVLSRSGAGRTVSSEVTFVSLDGSTGGQRLVAPDTWRAAATALVGSSVDGAPLYLLSGRRLLELDTAPPARWRGGAVPDDVQAPTYPG